MIQPSGMVCGMPSAYGFFLRSSPFMCVLDAIYVLAQRLVLRYRSPATSLQSIAKRRYQDIPTTKIWSDLQRITAFRLFIFFFGALPQAVRLIFLRGVPWTQALAAMYFGSFLIIELLVVFNLIHLPLEEPSSIETSTDPITNRDTKSSPAFSSVKSQEKTSNQQPPIAEVTMPAASIQPPDIITSSHDKYETWMAILSIGISNGLIIGLLLPVCYELIEMVQPMKYNLHSTLSHSTKFSLSFLIRGIVFFPFVRVFGREIFARPRNHAIRLTSVLYNYIICISMPVIMASEVILRSQNFCGMLSMITCASCVWMVGRAAWGTTNIKRMSIFEKWIFLAEHLLATILWYRFKYNPYYTVKPEWTALVSYKV